MFLHGRTNILIKRQEENDKYQKACSSKLPACHFEGTATLPFSTKKGKNNTDTSGACKQQKSPLITFPRTSYMAFLPDRTSGLPEQAFGHLAWEAWAGMPPPRACCLPAASRGLGTGQEERRRRENLFPADLTAPGWWWWNRQASIKMLACACQHACMACMHCSFSLLPMHAFPSHHALCSIQIWGKTHD